MANLNQSQLVVWKDELDNDPLARGYAGMSDLQATISGNTADIASTQTITVELWEDSIRSGLKWTQWTERAELQTVAGTFDAPDMQQIMSTFATSITEVDLRGDPYWEALLDAAVLAGDLGAGAAEAMKALCDTLVSRATQLLLPTITTADTAAARAL